MKHILSIVKRSVSTAALFFILGIFPTANITFADSNCVAPSGPGTSHPTGAAAGTYSYNCSDGLWENSYYTLDPSTGSLTPTYPITYTYNAGTGSWDSPQWVYVASSAGYQQLVISVSQPPSGAVTVGGPVTQTPPSTPPTGNSSTTTPQGAPLSSASIGSSEANTSQNTANNGSIDAATTTNTAMNMTNGLSSVANTGAAQTIGNTTAGGATSGDASSVANIANLLQSTSTVFGPNTPTFTTNINGDVNGDFMFDPSALIVGTGANSSNTGQNNLRITTNNDTANTAQLHNTINVAANSGAADVAQNTTAGNATSGNATAVADLMNLINSNVSSGKSFVGVININGNLNGDILLPPGLVDQLLTSTGAGSSNIVNSDTTGNLASTENNTTGIQNNITSAAQSGNANESQNTTGGNATTGKAATNITLLNLTGNTTIGKNNILVFVNVLGHWVGMIVNAPQGSTAASLSGGISSTGPNSNNAIDNTTGLSNTATTNNTAGITNDVNIAAKSGDANVSQNTTGGNATSGNANTAVNVLNIAGSNLNLSDWFGVLFINVIGNWNGSFGLNTSAGDPAGIPSSAATVSSQTNSAVTSPAGPMKQFASFISTSGSSAGSSSTDAAISAATSSATSASVLGAQTTHTTASTALASDTRTHADFTLPAIGASIAIVMLAGERIVTIRKNKKA